MRLHIAWIYALAATAYILIPQSFWVFCVGCCVKPQLAPNLKYQDCASAFAAHYDKKNPITKRKGKRRMLQHELEKERTKGEAMDKEREKVLEQ